MRSKIILLTGATSGIGEVTAKELASQGATIVLVARNKEKAKKLVDHLIFKTNNKNIDYIIGDLSLQSEVRKIANTFLEKYNTLDILINNAGLVHDHLELTEEGHELMMATNHYSSFLLTHLLLEPLKNSQSARVINVASNFHKFGKLDLKDINFFKRKFNMGAAYGASKIAMICCTFVLADSLRNDNVTVNVLHPGIINSNFGKGQKMPLMAKIMDFIMPKITPEEGAKTQIMLATSKDVEGVTGKYWNEKGSQKLSSKLTRDAKFAKEVYDFTFKTVNL